ncbi:MULTISPECIES: hypothetical protein [Lentibacillus]|uniref:Uncharacterized protein n=2 Tax=Bacteria TaxID=2 RepID=A0A549YHR7_9BACI|nr:MULTISPECIES: hypothetical protein [Lentibacillus]PJH69220.1 hypothetical protein CVR96_27475 [Salmonella enterica subsp. enterica serovar Typhimurium]TRM11397.1 hypothetical protein FH966_06635 [Lentibacillus cibarius]HLS08132.1 hypothetical protein [Lentibacillus sp.]
MQVINRIGERKIVIEAGYSEAHLISEALTMYRLWLQTLHGRNSEEEMLVGTLRHTIMNPTVERVTTCKEDDNE